tara:strand:- start:111 stop:644 length:534 start_codon:yes stop_codon:yes gene_type:complete
MNFGGSSKSIPVAVTPEWSVESSYPSVTFVNNNTIYEFSFSDGNMAVSYGMMIRLCQEGHIFKMLLFGGNGFRKVERTPGGSIETLQLYGITKEAFQALVLSLRTNNPTIAYKHKFMYESIGGFKTIDKHHIKRMKNKKENSVCSPVCSPNDLHKTNRNTYRTTINLISEDEDENPV